MPRSAAIPISLARMRRESIVPGGRQFWVTPELAAAARKAGPVFTIGSVGGVFFGRTASWIRQQESFGRFRLAGRPLEFGRDNRGAREFRLPDIEPMAHALYEHRAIDIERLRACIEIVKLIARQHGILKD